MSRSENAQLAVNMFQDLLNQHQWSAQEAWKGIAFLLMTCKRWVGRGYGWDSHHDVPTYREANDIGYTGSGNPNAYLRRGRDLKQYLASSLGVDERNLCSKIGRFYDHPRIEDLQPHNLKGHAFRSIVVNYLKRFGDSGISYEEEVNPKDLFPGSSFSSLSKDPRVDIVAWRQASPVALLSTRWGLRHDRMEVIQESEIYMNAAPQHCNFYPVLGENDVTRLEKVLRNSAPIMQGASITATVHHCPEMVIHGIDFRGERNAESRLTGIKDLSFLAQETNSW